MAESALTTGSRGHANFVHLRVKSPYSLLEGALPPKELAALCRAQRMPAVAVTDTNNLFGVYEIADTLAKGGVQPIVGVTLSVDLEASAASQQTANTRVFYPSLALLVKDEEGYVNLAKLISAAYLDVETGTPAHVRADHLTAFGEGLILLTGGPGGPVDRLIADGQPAAAEAALDRLHAVFGDRLYVELQRHGAAGEAAIEEKLIDLAYAKQIPLVATNDVHFGRADMYEAHDALLCIADGTFLDVEDRRRLTPEHRFKSAEEMAALFADLPEAIANTIEIARRCAFRPKKRNPILPQFVPESGLTQPEELRAQARAGLKRRLAEHGLFAEEKTYWDRLEFELGVIVGMDFAGYFLIVSDFMKWTRANGIPVGVRGSGATSLVAWALDITNLDPIRFGLVFERFLNPERISMPDFDIDFCQERRDEVVRYVQQKYGADRVGHIIALGSLQARAAVRDVGRVMQLPFGLVDRLAKLIPNPPGKPVSLRDAIENEPRLQQIAEQEPRIRDLFAIVEKIEGFYRHASTHPAGVVIGDRPLSEIVPLYRDPRSEMPVTQFDYEDAEKAGLVKFDFLGLKTLTVIAKTEELLKARGIALDTQRIDFDDRPPSRCCHAANASACSSSKARACAICCARCGPTTSTIWWRWSRSIGRVRWIRSPNTSPASTAAKSPDYLHPRAGADPLRNLRRDDLPGRRDAHRARARRLFHGRGRSLAPRHGQEDPVRNGEAPRHLHQGRGRQGHRAAHRGTDFRAGGEIRRLRLQQGPCRGLCAGRLSDGVSEGELSGRISGRVDDARYRQHRPAQHFPPGGGAPRHRGARARHQQEPGLFRLRCGRGPAAASSITRWPR